MNHLIRGLARLAGWAMILVVVLIPVFLFMSTMPMLQEGATPWSEILSLVFGTLKVTLYAILFGAPIALLAAIHTAELMRPQSRAILKPSIETLAMIPSVLYAIVVALFLAPLVDHALPSVIGSLLTVPLTFLLVAHLIPSLPRKLRDPLERWRILVMGFCVPVGIFLGIALGSLMEWLFFGGNLKLWLRDGTGAATGGWFLLAIPMISLITLWLMENYVSPRLMRGGPLLRFSRFVIGLLITIMLSWSFALLMDLIALDPREIVLGPYTQHNTFVVGLVLGVAIIPTIYTLSEDALSSVPRQLRISSLATGATRWQTAFQLIVPAAMSGLISALMIGMTRAMGETLILTLGSGRHLIVEANVFAEFRALTSELLRLAQTTPGSARARTLFLCTLLLILFTFVLSTVAELLRAHFRKKAHRL